MNDDLWIVVPNWEKFQRHGDREMVWIKLYTELNSRDDWRRLTFSQRGLLASIWTEYPRSGFRLRSVDLWGRVGQTDRHGNLEALVQAGFIELSPRPPARARAREEKRREEETPYPAERGTSDQVFNNLTPTPRKNSRAHGTNPRALRTNPRAVDEPRPKTGDDVYRSMLNWIDSPGFDPETMDEVDIHDELEIRQRKMHATISDEQDAALLYHAITLREKT